MRPQICSFRRHSKKAETLDPRPDSSVCASTGMCPGTDSVTYFLDVIILQLGQTQISLIGPYTLCEKEKRGHNGICVTDIVDLECHPH